MKFTKTQIAQAVFSTGSALVSTAGLFGQTNNLPLAILGGAAISGIVMSATSHLENTRKVKSLISGIALISVVMSTLASGYTGYTYMNQRNIADNAGFNSEIDARYQKQMKEYRAELKKYKQDIKNERNKASSYANEEADIIKNDIKKLEQQSAVLEATFENLNKLLLDGKPSVSTQKKVDKVSTNIDALALKIQQKRKDLKASRVDNAYKAKDIPLPEKPVKEAYKEVKMNTEALFIPLFGDLVVILIGLYRRSYILERGKQALIDADNDKLSAEIHVYKHNTALFDAEVAQINKDNAAALASLNEKLAEKDVLLEQLNAQSNGQESTISGQSDELDKLLLLLDGLKHAKKTYEAQVLKLEAGKKSILGEKIKQNKLRLQLQGELADLSQLHKEQIKSLHTGYEEVGQMIDAIADYQAEESKAKISSIHMGYEEVGQMIDAIADYQAEDEDSYIVLNEAANEQNISISNMPIEGDWIKATDLAKENAMSTTMMANLVKDYGIKSMRVLFNGKRSQCYSVKEIASLNHKINNIRQNLAAS